MEMNQNYVTQHQFYAQATLVEIYGSTGTSQKRVSRQSYFIFQVHLNFTKRRKITKLQLVTVLDAHLYNNESVIFSYCDKLLNSIL